jgi:hypothetical protein
MTIEMFGAGCFGAVIGFVAWHVFSAGEVPFKVRTFSAFIAALLGAGVLSVFPAGTTLFAAYASGLALGFFVFPVLPVFAANISSAVGKAFDVSPKEESGDFASQLAYIEEHWPEIEGVVNSELQQNNGTITQFSLLALPLDESGKIAVLKRYVRKYPERAIIRPGILGYKLKLLDSPPGLTERDERRGLDDGGAPPGE